MGEIMEILLDTANIEEIKKYCELYEIKGVTTNPTILSTTKGRFFELFLSIRKIINDRQLHIQVTADSWEDMVKEAEAIVESLGKDVYIKVPVNEQGIRAIKELKSKNLHVTATAVYTIQQAILASTVGADYVAPYFNRMNNLNIDSKKVIEEIVKFLENDNSQTKVLAASFKNTQQIMDSLTVGAHAVTIPGALLTQMVSNTVIDGAVSAFKQDWIRTYGDKKIFEL